VAPRRPCTTAARTGTRGDAIDVRVSSMRRVPWVVVGGGIAGLDAARRLGVPVPGGVLVEATGRFGGIVRSEYWQGAVLDLGPDGWVAAKPQVGALCMELGLGDDVIKPLPAAARLLALHEGALTPMPAGLKLTVPTTPSAARRIAARDKNLARRVLLEPLVARKNWDDPLADESIGDFVRRRMGKRWAAEVSLPILAGIHSGDPNELSVRAAFPQFVEAERRAGSLVADAFRRRKGGEVGTFLSLRGGMQTLVDALATEAARHAELRLDAPVQALAGASAGGALVTLSSGETLHAERVVLATGPRVAALLLQAAVPELAANLAQVPHRSAHVVLFALREESVAHALDASGFIALDRRAGGVVAATFLSSKWQGRKAPGHVIVRAFVAPGVALDADAADDDAIAARALEDLRPLLGIVGKPEKHWVRRFVDATPQPVVGHRARMQHARTLEAALPWLALIGAGYDGVGLGDAVRSAVEATSAPQGFTS
jgi:oxygen-dependent protoporphyrinogen oxidase